MRPAVLFGGEGVLINNIAWLLRRLAVFAAGGTGAYRIRPVHLGDLARLCLAAGPATGTYPLDAAGPERPAFYDLVRFINDALGGRSRVVGVPGALIPPAARVRGWALRDTLLTGEEYRAMAGGLAGTDGPATGQVALTEWITQNKDSLGRRYAHEIGRHCR